MQISVIIPVFNGGSTFGRCLAALWKSDYSDWECIVVDDGSTDNSVEIAQQFGARVVCSKRPKSGPAIARNLGAKSAQGDILFFIDADVLVKTETLSKVADVLGKADVPAACIGSYDDYPTEGNFLSQYRNLLHHFTHQTANEEATTFWTGCGAIRRQVFEEMEGFSTNFPRPSIEDIEFGYRLKAQGYRISMAKHIQVSHMKRWTAVNLLLTDIRERAIPWAKLILTEGAILNDLNLSMSQRLSSAVALLGAITLLLSPIFPEALYLVGLTAVLLLIINRAFYRFLQNKRGFAFMLQTLPWHWLYFIYSGLSFGACFIWFRLFRFK